jgi:hypothetical protein
MVSPMKMTAMPAVAILCAMAAACQSPSGLAEKTPTWTAVYGVPYDVLTNCLVERERGGLTTVTPAFYAQERRATISVTTPTGSALGVYEIRQISGGTEVAYRSIYGGPTTDAGGGAFEKAKRCGNGG